MMSILKPKRDWRAEQEEYEKWRKFFTCPVCGKHCHGFMLGALPTHGFVGSGQWYCGKTHWKQDKNSSYWTKGIYKKDPDYKGETDERTTVQCRRQG